MTNPNHWKNKRSEGHSEGGLVHAIARKDATRMIEEAQKETQGTLDQLNFEEKRIVDSLAKGLNIKQEEAVSMVKEADGLADLKRVFKAKLDYDALKTLENVRWSIEREVAAGQFGNARYAAVIYAILYEKVFPQPKGGGIHIGEKNMTINLGEWKKPWKPYGAK